MILVLCVQYISIIWRKKTNYDTPPGDITNTSWQQIYLFSDLELNTLLSLSDTSLLQRCQLKSDHYYTE